MPVIPSTSRREFIRLLGGALGGVTLAPLAGCGGDDDNDNTPPGPAPMTERLTETPLPSAYQFFPILDVNQTPITPGIMINDQSRILLYSIAETPAGAATGSVLELSMDFSAATPAITSMRPIVSIGDTLADGRRVDRIGVADTNNQGDFVVVIDTYASALDEGTADNISAVYRERNQSGLQALLGFRDDIPGIGKYGGAFGDLALNDNGDVLLVSHFTGHDTVQGQQGLIHLPNLNPQQANMVLQTGDLIPQSSGIIRAFGLTDLNSNGQCLVAAYLQRLSQQQGSAALPELCHSLEHAHHSTGRDRCQCSPPAVNAR